MGSCFPVYVLVLADLSLVGFYCYVYVHFMKTDPDALRSERYSLRKLELQKGLIGDNRTGLIKPEAMEDEPETTDEVAPQQIADPRKDEEASGGAS